MEMNHQQLPQPEQQKQLLSLFIMQDHQKHLFQGSLCELMLYMKLCVLVVLAHLDL